MGWVSIMEDKLVTIAEYMDSMQAEMALQVLAGFGIKGTLMGRHGTDVLAGVPGFSTVKLQVMQSKAEEARQILESKEPSYTPEELEDLEDMDEFGGPEEPKEL